MSSTLKTLDTLFWDWEVGYLTLAVRRFKADGSTARDRLREENDIRLTDPQVAALIQLASTL